MAVTEQGVNTLTQDLVAVLDNASLEQLFQTASPMRVSVKEEGKLTKFAVEDGTTRSDHFVRSPYTVTVDFLLTEDTRNGFQELRTAYKEHRLLAVQTKVDIYQSLLITSIPHDETPEGGDSIAVPITFEQWETVQPEYGTLPPRKVANKNQASTVKRGQQQTTETPPAKRQSVLFKAFN